MIVRNLNKSFERKILDNVSFEVEEGEVVTIIGPSGSGKSTILRSLNCLELPESGEICFSNECFDYSKVTEEGMKKIREKSSMVFQNYNLFINKTALQNVTEHLTKVKKISKKEANQLGLEYLEMVGLREKSESYPSQLSGGQQQRVGIARSLAMKPYIMLFDEPTSALDPELIKSVLEIIKSIASKGQTMLIVTHEINFAREISDKIIFIEDGRIIEQGTPEEIIDKPKNERIQQFLDLITL